jgi:hypothetical protein
MLRLLSFIGLLGMFFPPAAHAQGSTPGQMDSLLSHLIGRWRMTGTVLGRPVVYTLLTTRELEGRFVELHMTDVQQPPAYEARVFIGVDSARAQYVAHWLDNFGAPYSIPHATESAQGDTVHLAFAYADGPFRDTFVYHRVTGTWYFRLESQDSTGAWRLFGAYDVSPQP